MRGVHVVLTALAAAVALIVLAGCGGPVDTAKETYTRTTVPAGAGIGGGTNTGKPKTNDAAFTNEKLRELDPCGLLTEDLLASVGTPADNSLQDYGSCSNYMEDKDGKELSITLYVGETVSNAEDADKNIGGLPALENPLDDGSACFTTVVTSTNPNFGIKVQVGGEGEEELCVIGTTVMTSVVDLIRTDPPVLDIKRGSLIDADPCTLLEQDTVDTTLGIESEIVPYTLHWCNWSGDSVNLGIWFRTGYDPKDSSTAGTPVDLGSGITGYQEATVGTGVTCRLEWRHRSTGEDGADEIVAINLDKSETVAGEKDCAATVAVAQHLIPTLPKP